MKISIKNEQQQNLFCLVPDGWFPLGMISGKVILIDKNISSKILSEPSKRSRADSLWIEALQNSGNQINPILCAYENSHRRTPTLEEFCEEATSLKSRISIRLPRAKLVEHSAESLQKIFSALQEKMLTRDREARFLVRATPKFLHRPRSNQVMQIVEEIVSLADSERIDRTSLVVLGALSCVCEAREGSKTSPARRILKPSGKFELPDAYNATSDLHALEFLVMSMNHQQPPVSLCTMDRALAGFWVWCQPRKPTPTYNDKLSFTINFSSEMFPRLNKDQLLKLLALINSRP